MSICYWAVLRKPITAGHFLGSDRLSCVAVIDGASVEKHSIQSN